MAEKLNLKTQDGIAEARKQLYTKLIAGEIHETRALQMEEVLRALEMILREEHHG
jgi:hypothetical protein